MSDWWIPRSVEDLEAAVERGDVTETYHLDFKQFTHAHDEETKIRVPPRCREVGHGLAVNGGVVVIGVAELHARGCTYANRNPLAGLRDSVGRMIGGLVTPSLRVTISELVRDEWHGLPVVRPRDTESRRLLDHEVRALATAPRSSR